MDPKHREAIRKNFSSLVEQTDLDLMVTVLYEKGVFSEAMVEPYKDTNKTVRDRKRILYMAIPTRGPDAFGHLIDALMENGYWELVRALDPKTPLNTKPQRPGESFLSIFYKKRNGTGKEQNDLNSNPPGGSSEFPLYPSPGSSGYSAAPPSNGNLHSNDDEPKEGEVPGPGGDAAQSTIPQFNVIKSTRFFDDIGSDIALYRTRGRRRGVLLQFSYIAFKHNMEEFREGARVDIDNLRYLFTELGFKTPSYLNLSLQETKDTLSELSSGLLAEGFETVFVVFSSHGYARSGSGDTDIRCSDGSLISYYEIIDYFNNDNFPKLNGIPKVFIFQTCRGSNKDFVRAPAHLHAPEQPRARAPHSSARTAQDGRRYDSPGAASSATATATDAAPSDHYDKTVDRMYSDILIAHSTVPGYASNRDKLSGSWYIQALCAVFAERAHDAHVEKLLTLVDRQLQAHFRTQTSSVDRWGFNKRLYLHPGLYEDDS